VCLIALAWKVRADLPLVVAANRDEWRERPAQPAHWWPDHPQILAGRDLQAGGTWMGVTTSGRFAAVTNFRDPSDKRSTARSRGGLVTDFLTGTESAARYLSNLSARDHEYNGFNLIVGDGLSLLYYGSREGHVRPIERGVYGLSNHLLDEPWPKVTLARREMQAAMEESDPMPRLFAMLSNDAPAADLQLPHTGVGVPWERRLSAALITGEDYGTRASTALAIAADGDGVFEERTRSGDGAVSATSRHRWTLRDPVPAS
jgi:uncharacterized protein with NRDE domain